MRYRSPYRKNPRKKQLTEAGSGLKIFIVFLLCSAVLFAAAILLGNYLKNEAEGGPYPDAPLNTTDENSKLEFFNVANVPVIIGEYRSPDEILGKSTDTDDETESSSGTKSAVSYNATSLLLRMDDDTLDPQKQGEDTTRLSTGLRLSYTSELAESAAFDALGTDTAAKLIGEAKKKYNYVSGLFEVRFFEESSTSASMIREYELGLLVELCECGLDDVVLTGFSAKNLTVAVDFIKELNQKTGGKLKAGIALPFNYYESDDVRSNIKALQYSCGFLALDLRNSNVPSLMTARDFVSDRVGRIASTVSLFSVRVIVGISEETDYKIEVDAAFKAGALNIQACGRTLQQND